MKVLKTLLYVIPKLLAKTLNRNVPPRLPSQDPCKYCLRVYIGKSPPTRSSNFLHRNRPVACLRDDIVQCSRCLFSGIITQDMMTMSLPRKEKTNSSLTLSTSDLSGRFGLCENTTNARTYQPYLIPLRKNKNESCCSSQTAPPTACLSIWLV